MILNQRLWKSIAISWNVQAALNKHFATNKLDFHPCAL
jgi:hypothetical protein